MQDLDQTIVTPGKTIKFEKIELRPHLIILYPQTQFKQMSPSAADKTPTSGSTTSS